MSETGSPSFWHSSRRVYLTRALVVYLGVSYAVLELVDIFVDQLGLPGWFFPGTLVLLLLGLPIVVATAWVQGRGRKEAWAGAAAGERVVREPETGEGLAGEPRPVAPARRHWLTWRRALVGGAAVLVLWGVVVAGYMAMRALGIGPVGSLVAAGVLDAREPILIADFKNNTSDPLLGQAATEAFRIDFSQSSILTVMEPASVARVLARMERDPNAPLDLDLAREVAVRAGLKAVVAGDITPVGSGFVLAAQLVSAEDGKVLAAYRESARDSTAIIGAIDRLSDRLRGRIGESLKTIRGNEPLDQVTTRSLEALRKYSQAVEVIEAGDDERGIALLEETVAIDTAFAMAWRKLGIALGNIGRDRARQVESLTRAYEHRDRLTDRERYLTLGSYHMSVTGDMEQAKLAYQTLLDLYPTDTWAMNNLGIVLENARDFRGANELFRRAIEVDSARGAIYYGNAISTQVALNDFDGAKLTLERLSAAFPEHPTAALTAAALASAQFDYPAAESGLRAFRESQRASAFWQFATTFWLAQLAEVRGQLDEAERLMRQAMGAAEQQGLTAQYLNAAVRIGFYDAMLRQRPERAVQTVDAALARQPLAEIDPLERPYALLAIFYALVEQRDRAAALLQEHERVADPKIWFGAEQDPEAARGVLALADERYDDAIAAFRAADRGGCPICALPMLGLAYDGAGVSDSVVAIYERYITTPFLYRLGATDWWALAGIYERLGGLYELRGESERAIRYYNRLVELWQEADPALQPRVEAARRAIRRLSAET